MLGAGEKSSEQTCLVHRLNRLVLGKLLSKLGYEIMYGTNGIEAVHVFERTMAAKRAEQDGLFCILMVCCPPPDPALSLEPYLLQCLVRA